MRNEYVNKLVEQRIKILNGVFEFVGDRNIDLSKAKKERTELIEWIFKNG